MNQDKIWDFYQNEKIGSFDSSYPRLYELVRKFKKDDKVLNIGVGGGVFERKAEEYNLDIYSLDPNENSINRIKNIIGTEKAKVGYSQNIPFKSDFFDGVVMSEVLEHLNDEIIDLTLFDISRVLKKGGKFIGTVPFNENLDEQLVVCPKCGERFHRWGHVQSFNIQRIEILLAPHFENIIVKPQMYISWKNLNYKGKISSLVKYVFFLLGVKKNGLNIYFEGWK